MVGNGVQASNARVETGQREGGNNYIVLVLPVQVNQNLHSPSEELIKGQILGGHPKSDQVRTRVSIALRGMFLRDSLRRSSHFHPAMAS
jgi:hypothetical protein